MNGRLQRFAFRWLARAQKVRVDECVHFGAFSYGCGEFNPEENYASAFARGESAGAARVGFEDFLLRYRPVNFGEALGLELERDYGLWQYPWTRRAFAAKARPTGWCNDPAEVPDIFTHFSSLGILRAQIDEEFRRLEEMVDSIRRHGYQPERFRCRIAVRKLVRLDGAARFIVYDGNHRLSALAALGFREIVAHHVPLMTVRENDLKRWPRVVDGSYTAADATRVFRAYFNGNPAPRTSGATGSILVA